MFIKDFMRKILYSNRITKSICMARIKICEWYKIAYPVYKQKICNSKAVFLVMTPEHSNLGDHAIAKAEIEMLEKEKIEYIEITGKKLNDLQCTGYLHIFNGRTILVNGGGNLGTLWYDVEECFRNLIESNPDSKIICLPNTIFYENSEWGKEELQKSINIYNAHSDLVLCARENISYDMMKSIYKNVFLIPDMVFSLNYSEDIYNRNGCLMCFRNDKERTLTDEKRNLIRKQVKEIFGENVIWTDMHAVEKFPVNKRNDILDEKFKDFLSSELVITDRLHGMIFAAITGTPCIVVNSKSHKVEGCYQWIKHLEYVKFAEDTNQIIDLYNSIPKKRHRFDNRDLLKYYEKLVVQIKKE